MLAVVIAAAGNKAGGLPQFDVSTFAPQLAWLALGFTALYFVLSRVALPRIGEVIDERKNRIQKDLADAERLKGETDKALKSYEEALASAKARAGTIAKETRDRLSGETDRERAQVDQQLAAKITDAEKRIGDMKSKAMASVNDIAADTAGAIVSKLLGKDVARTDVLQALTKRT